MYVCTSTRDSTDKIKKSFILGKEARKKRGLFFSFSLDFWGPWMTYNHKMVLGKGGRLSDLVQS